MKNLIPQCLVCERTEEQVPLIQWQFQSNTYWICPQDLPTLIHHPDQLVGRLPGAEELAPYEEN